MSIWRRSAGPMRRMDRLTAEEGLIQEARGMAGAASRQMGTPDLPCAKAGS